MQQTIFNLHGHELSPREQVIADLAFKISTTPTITNGACVDRLRAYNLEEEEIGEVIKLATFLSYWQQNHKAEAVAPQPEVRRALPRTTLETDLPYYFESAYPPEYGER